MKLLKFNCNNLLFFFFFFQSHFSICSLTRCGIGDCYINCPAIEYLKVPAILYLYIYLYISEQKWIIAAIFRLKLPSFHLPVLTAFYTALQVIIFYPAIPFPHIKHCKPLVTLLLFRYRECSDEQCSCVPLSRTHGLHFLLFLMLIQCHTVTLQIGSWALY